MLKVFVQAPGAKAPETHVFAFTSATAARAEADAIKEVLGKAVQQAKSGETGVGAATASMFSSKTTASDNLDALYDDNKLQGNTELQQSLLKANASLSRTFMESLRTKPDSLTSTQFAAQFWSTRIPLLRAHAIERRQTRGSYNVLSTIRPVVVDNTTKLSINKEQIQLIFSQHPLVKRVYDENVPRLSEESFWSRFFQSKLFKKLKGERTTDADAADDVLDKYLHVDEDQDRARRMLAAHIPHIIDIEGNEENHSQRKGNAPDRTMRPTSIDKVPIIRTLNALSEKILSKVSPNDVDPSQPIGVDEETFNTLALRDLQADAEDNRVVLNIRDQSKFFSAEKDNVSEDALRFAQQDPRLVLQELQQDLSKACHLPDLLTSIDQDIDSDDEEAESGGRSKATAQILDLVAQYRRQDEGEGALQENGLSQATFDRLTLTHATTTEFLQYFWSAFLASRGSEISRLVETLDRAMSRIDAVAVDAEAERQKEADRLKKQLADYMDRTGKKRKVDFESIPGGRKAVEQLLRPTVRAIQVATQQYRTVLTR